MLNTYVSPQFQHCLGNPVVLCTASPTALTRLRAGLSSQSRFWIWKKEGGKKIHAYENCNYLEFIADNNLLDFPNMIS